MPDWTVPADRYRCGSANRFFLESSCEKNDRKTPSQWLQFREQVTPQRDTPTHLREVAVRQRLDLSRWWLAQAPEVDVCKMVSATQCASRQMRQHI